MADDYLTPETIKALVMKTTLSGESIGRPASRALCRSHEKLRVDLENLKNLFEAMLNVPDDVTMGEVKETMREALGNDDGR